MTNLEMQYIPLIEAAKAELRRLEAEYDAAVRKLQLECEHKNPDGTPADDGGIAYGHCTICGASLG